MEQLPPQKYQIVLKYMQATSQQNFQQAASALYLTQFNLQTAINNKFNPPQQNHRQRHRNNDPARDQEIVRKYLQYLRKKHGQSNLIKSAFSCLKSLFFGIFGLLSLICISVITIVPQSVRILLFGSSFDKNNYQNFPEGYRRQSLQSLLKMTRNFGSRSILVILVQNTKDEQINKFFKNKDLIQALNKRSFWITNITQKHPKFNQLKRQNNLPIVVCLRQNIFEELVEVGRSSLSQIDAVLLNRWAHQSRNLYRRDNNVLIKYRKLVAQSHGIFLDQSQEEQVNLIQNHTKKTQIHEQNKAYLDLQEQQKIQKKIQQQKKRKQQQQRRLKQQMEQEKQLRKMSIPDQPKQGDIVRINFRCPEGKTIVRNFLKQQKLQLIYHWVQLNQQIQFQDEKRQFQLLYSYPPTNLQNRKNEILRDIFESQIEKIVIKQI